MSSSEGITRVRTRAVFWFSVLVFARLYTAILNDFLGSILGLEFIGYTWIHGIPTYLWVEIIFYGPVIWLALYQVNTDVFGDVPTDPEALKKHRRLQFIATAAIALILYGGYPVAPPRLLPEWDFVDTLERFSNLAYQTQSTAPFVNPYAAVPSLHVGWALLVIVAVFLATPSWLWRVVSIALFVLQSVAVVATANHYILDAMAGLLAAMGGLLIALALQRWGYAGVQRLLARRGLRSIAGTGSRD